MEIHALTKSDVPRFKSLLQVFAQSFDDPEHEKPVPSDAYLESLLAKTHFIALAAMEGETVVAGVTAYELEKYEQERKEIYLYDLAVLEAYRRKGIATALITELQRIAKARGAYVIFVQADVGDDAAIRLYESLGKKEEVLHFDIAV